MFHKLQELQTTVVYGTVWLQFAMQVLTVWCDLPVFFSGEGGVVVVGGLGLEMAAR